MAETQTDPRSSVSALFVYCQKQTGPRRWCGRKATADSKLCVQHLAEHDKAAGQ